MCPSSRNHLATEEQLKRSNFIEINMKSKCAQHPEQDGLARCKACGAFLCADCVRTSSTGSFGRASFFYYYCSKCRPHGERPKKSEIAFMRKQVAEPLSNSEIHEAARDGHLEKIKGLLSNDPSLAFCKGKDDWTPLHHAASNGHKDVAELLLANKANVNADNNDAKTPLHEAAVHGHLDVAELLLANKAVVNVRDNFYSTPLEIAVLRGHMNVAELLRIHGGQE
jgi:hypothetical protein